MRKKEALTHIEDMFSLYPYINRICEMREPIKRSRHHPYSEI